MVKCTYCGENFDPQFKGVIIADSITGAVRNYCSSKCRKNANRKRTKKKWATAFEEKKKS
ncbi:hypothetical protein HYW76_00465 [Candidatus Pacearchaeota archaeon]|nr:hypothetical protein [Candidatus Pacearchaeota archaeon]